MSACACGCGAPVALPGLYVDAKHQTWRHQAAVRSAQNKARRREERLARTCAADGCSAPVPLRNHLFCSAACRNRTESLRKGRADWNTKGQRHPRAAILWEMRREADAAGRKGLCLFCPTPLAHRRHLICPAVGCVAEYQSLYRKGRRKGQAAEVVPLPEAVDATDAATELGAIRQSIACEMDSFRAKVAALARDYGVAA